MRRRSIVVAGVGGQGQVTIGSILGEALSEKGYNVSIGEVHGLSQRGGSVVVFIKYGEGTVSPIVTQGEADLIIGLELIETVRRLPLGRKETLTVVNDFVLPPPSAEKIPSREELIHSLKSNCSAAYLLDAQRLALKAGSELTVNMVMVGAALATQLLDLEPGDIREALVRRFKGDVLRANIEALRLGYEEVKKQRQES